MKPASLRTQVSSGGVIFRRNGDGFEIALTAVRGGNIWCLPKGLINKGETPDKTALREVAEETGLHGKILEKLGEITYWYYIKEDNSKCRKTVHFFLMEFEDGDIANHDWEVDSVDWFPISEALEKASYKGEREIIEKAKRRLLYGKNTNLART